MTEPRSRREFMGLTAAGAAGALARPWLGDAHALSTAFAPSVDPDLVVFNAKVYTMDPAVPQAEGFAVSGGRFVAVGKSADIRALAGLSYVETAVRLVRAGKADAIIGCPHSETAVNRAGIPFSGYPGAWRVVFCSVL